MNHHSTRSSKYFLYVWCFFIHSTSMAKYEGNQNFSFCQNLFHCSHAKKNIAVCSGRTFSGFSKAKSNHFRDNEYQSIKMQIKKILQPAESSNVPAGESLELRRLTLNV